MSDSNNARKLLANKLKLLRFTHAWSQEELAERSGLHRTYISAIECTQCNLSLDNLERLARAFGISPAELLSEPQADDLLAQWQTWRCEESAPLYVVH